MAPYPTPKPCSIGPDDCALLYSSWTSHWHSLTQASPNYNQGLLNPPCETSRRPEPTYSTNAKGEQCDNCQIAGHQIRLLYWPVTTAKGGDLCSNKAQTVTSTTTGPPRSFVTDGITITSPTIGISISGLSRVDDCGTTIDHTIIPVLPEDVSSVQGARALFTHRAFNFADLNYKCLDAPDLDFVTTGTRTDCYREVPASDYFFGYANAAGVDWAQPGAFANRTIWPNYQPQVLPPNTLTEAIRSLWGADCNIHPDGIWDPPIALQQEKSFPLPECGPGAQTSYYTPHTDVPQPGGPTTPHAPQPTMPITPTAVAEQGPGGSKPTGGSGNGGGGSGGGNGGGGSGRGNVGQDNQGGGDGGKGRPEDHQSGGGGQQNGGGGEQGGSENDESNDGGSSGGGSNNGGSNNGGSNNGGSNNGGSNDGGSNDGGSNDGGSTDSESIHGGLNDGGSNVGGSNVGGSNNDGSNDGGNGASSPSPGYEIIRTTVITYTSAPSSGGGDDAGKVVTSTFLVTSTAPHNSPAASGEQVDATAPSNGREPSSTDVVGGDDDGGRGSGSGSISSAIQSGIGGGGSSGAQQQQQNVAASIAKTVGSRMTALAVLFSVFL